MEVDRKAMEELVRGREFANQLSQVFINGGGDIINDQLATTAKTPILFARYLLNNVLNSFAKTIILLDKKHTTPMHKRDFSFIGPPKSEDSQQSSPGRGCYKRRKATLAREMVSETIRDDGHNWRKYGQKIVLNSKYARNYYRCTHKIDQRCEATKQVQKIQEKPPLYKTTYYSYHTCSDDAIIILDPTSPSPDNTSSSSSTLLSFSSSTTFPTPTTKQSSSVVKYCKEEVPSASLDDSQLLSILDQPTLDTSSTALMHPSTKILEYSDHMDMLYGLLYDNDQLDDFFQPLPGFS